MAAAEVTWIPSVSSLGDDFDEDFILDVCGLKPAPEPITQISPLSPDQLAGCLRVKLEEEKHIFRHAKEVQKGSRGGYLKGFVTLPPDAVTRVLRLEFSVIPSLPDLLVHPHLLHLTVFTENQKKASYKTPLKSPSDWRMVFVVEYGSKVYHVPNYGNQRKVQLSDTCLENKDGEIRLLLGNNKVLINVISTLQGNSKKEDPDSEGNAITNLDVIERRIAEESWQYPELQSLGVNAAKTLAARYTNKDFKVELHRCRLRICTFDAAGTVPQFSAVSVSEVISNARDKNVGYLDVRSISDPGCCCTKGGWRFFLISEHKLAKEKAAVSKPEAEEDADRSPPVVPVLALADSDNNIVDDINGALTLNQIPTDPRSFEVHGDTFSILMPQQSPYVLDMIRRQGLHCRIFLYRCLDKKFSNNSVKFVYYDHGAFNADCPFCLIKSISQSTMENTLNSSGSGNKRSRKRTKTSTGSLLSPPDLSSLSPYSDSSGISSPGSSSEYTAQDQMSPYSMTNTSSVGTISATSGSFYSQEGTMAEEWADGSAGCSAADLTHGLGSVPDDMDGMWLQDQDIGALIFDLANEDLNAACTLPLPDSWKKEAKDSVNDDDDDDDDDEVPGKFGMEDNSSNKTDKTDKSDKTDEVDVALKKLNIAGAPEASGASGATSAVSFRSDFWLEISAVIMALVLYYVGGFIWKSP